MTLEGCYRLTADVRGSSAKGRHRPSSDLCFAHLNVEKLTSNVGFE